MSKIEHKLIGESNAYLSVLEQVSQLTRLNRPVLIVGERGTGKELIAERLHFLSDRWAKPLIKMNCAALSDALLESELFGHEAGAFTGASKRHIGRFERADGGTLFLDELATMSMKTQEKILRFIEYGDFERLGGSVAQKVDVRLVAATNEDLPSLAEEGKFRHDLLDRLAFDVVTLPPLRERPEDIILLAEFFAISMCKELGLAYFPGFSNAAKQDLMDHSWPGNIRELKNAVERSVYRQQEADQPLGRILLDPFASPFRLRQIEREPQPAKHRSDATTQKNMSFPPDFKDACQQQEIQWIEAALHKAKFNQKDAARMLGLTYHQLRALLRKYAMVQKTE
ncbi:MAG: phage shock protein operon transcriptional activator [Cellvibrionaceae bacterium]|nr:phage shock protein operon transcriptional activator [Cellvibrionaceae bacterium]